MPAENKYGKWPKSGEIDIMEYVGYENSKIFQTIHTEKYNHKNKTMIGSNYKINSYDDFVIYDFIWYPDKLEWYTNNKKIFETKYLANKTKDVEQEYFKVFPFDKEFYLIINLAIGGDWGGKKE